MNINSLVPKITSIGIMSFKYFFINYKTNNQSKYFDNIIFYLIIINNIEVAI